MLVGNINEGLKVGKQFFIQRIRVKDFYMGLCLLLFALVLIFWITPSFVGNALTQSHLKVHPGTFPNLIGYVLILLSVLLIFQSPRTSLLVSRREDKRFSWITLLCIGCIFTLFFISLLIGILPASIVITFIMMRIYGFKKLWIRIVIAVIFPTLLFLFFEKVAQVQIPRGIWFEGWY